MSTLHHFSCKDGYMEDMPFLEQIVAMSGSIGDGHHFLGCVDSESSNGEQNLASPYLSSWNLELDKETNLDSELGDVLIDPRTMAPVNAEQQTYDDLDYVIDISPSDDFSEGNEDIACSEEMAKPSIIPQPENAIAVPSEANLVEDQSWNREVVLIQIAPTSKSNGASVKLRNADSTKNVITQTKPVLVREERYEKPPFSYSCLIALALKNSESGFLPVSEIYSFILDNFPFFRTAPDGWKNSIRHNLSLNKCFQKLETPSLNGTTRKACLWGLNEDKIARLDEDILKWTRRTSDTKQVLSSYKAEMNDKIVQGEQIPTKLNEENNLPVIVPSNTQSTWIGSLADQSDVKLYKIIKVTSESSQPSYKSPEIAIKKEIEEVNDAELLVPNPILVLEDYHDPMVGGLTAQNGLYDDLTETGELREAARSFSIAQTSSQSVCRHSNESSMIRKTVMGLA